MAGESLTSRCKKPIYEHLETTHHGCSRKASKADCCKTPEQSCHRMTPNKYRRVSSSHLCEVYPQSPLQGVEGSSGFLYQNKGMRWSGVAVKPAVVSVVAVCSHWQYSLIPVEHSKHMRIAPVIQSMRPYTVCQKAM